VPVVTASGGTAQVVTAGLTEASARPLGLRYSVLKYAGEGEYLEVDPELVFRSGDKIRLRVEVNDPGYLYILHQGSSGSWRVMFPAPDYDAGSNRVAPGRTYDIPGRTRLVFDEQSGVERLFLVLTRQPEKDLDSLIYQLETGAAKSGPEKPKPVKTMMASAAIGNPTVQEMRGRVVARDLVFEKVKEEAPLESSGRKSSETAVYVVNRTGSTDSRLIAELGLQHR
jgi:hypothetical protein